MFIFFIGESIGWQELILIGTLALIFLGPRKLPQILKTVGKTMAQFKNMGQEFRETWEKEVSLDEDEKRILKNPLDENLILAEEKYSEPEKKETKIQMPEVRQISEKDFPQINGEKPQAEKPVAESVGKQDWF